MSTTAPLSLHPLSDDVVRVAGTIAARRAAEAAAAETLREPLTITPTDDAVHHVYLGPPTVSPEPIFNEARARGMELPHDAVEWDNAQCAWTIDGMDPTDWLDAMSPVEDHTMYVVIARDMKVIDGLSTVVIDAARYVLAPDVMAAITGMAQFLDAIEYVDHGGAPEHVATEGALTFAAYPGASAPRFLACTAADNRALMLADPHGAVLTITPAA